MKSHNAPKVCHVITSSTLRGGTERFLTRLLLALQKVGISQHVVCRNDKPEILEFCHKHNIPVTSCSLKKRDLLSKYKVWQTFRKFHPDIAISWLPRAAQRVPKGPWVRCAQVTWHQGAGCYANADALFVPSPGLKDHMATQIDKPIYVLPHFTDHVSEQLPKKEPRTPPMILGLGRFDHVKGFDLAIQAMKDLPNAQLWLVGEGDEKETLLDLVDILGLNDRVHFHPWAQDIAPLLAKASAVVVPSRQEALGLVILEAWRQMVPVVATKTDGPAYLIEEGKNGLLVNTESPKDLANALKNILADQEYATALGKNGKKELEEKHSEAATVKAYLAVFETLSAKFKTISHAAK